ncbi:MAG: long-chain fatty acid--CoA ligase [Thermoleophilaceae bacterium]|nr:long-chain fatty acid--CoA ligase [Thermoleophilaceae bacterium]
MTERNAALDAPTLAEAFQSTAARRGDAPALRTIGDEVLISWSEYAERVETIAGGLAALGLEPGDTLAFMMINRPEFHLIDTAGLHLGAVCFSIYNTSSPSQIQHLLEDAAPKIVVCEKQFLPLVEEARALGGQVEHVVVIDDGGLEMLENTAAPAGFDFEARWRAVEAEDVLMLIYTSGTTGPPKGVELTHANVMWEANALVEAVPVPVDGRSISFLPAAHVADRLLNHDLQMIFGTTLTTCPEPPRFFEHAIEVRPTLFGAVPRIWEKLKAALEAGGVDAAAADDATAQAIRQRIGVDKVEVFLVGAAATPDAVLEFFGNLGIPICELWGMSETSAVATINRPDAIRPGTVGTALPGVELKLAEDGELMVRGPLVMRGYRNLPEKTRETFTDDGWLLTGDIAEISDDGYVKIVDRKKELIINAAGKNMSPANIENKVKSADPLVGSVMAIGDGRPFNVALITLDPDMRAGRSVEDLTDQVKAAVETANADLSRVEQIKRFDILDEEWLPGGDELTPTMKLKRKPILAKYEETVERLYER